jgi:hypothetical protein
VVTARDVLIFSVGFLLGVDIWQITNIIHDTRWIGQERRKTERRKQELNAL